MNKYKYNITFERVDIIGKHYGNDYTTIEAGNFDSVVKKFKEQFLSFIQGYNVNHEYIKELEKEDFVCFDTASHSIGLKIDLDKLFIFPTFDIEDEYPPAPWRF